MSTSIFSVSLSPVPVPDSYQVSAGGQFQLIVTDALTNSPGVLENDEAVPGGNGFSLEVTGVGASPDSIQTDMTLTSLYGQWTVQSDGGLTYVASGLASKKLASGQTAGDVLYYREINDLDESAVGQVTMTVHGMYDPLEVVFSSSVSYWFDEDTWLQQNQSFPLLLPFPSATVTFIDNNAVAQVTTYYNIVSNLLPEDLAVYDEYATIFEKFQSTVTQLSISEIDFGFLRPGDRITVQFYSTITDGTTTLTSPVSELIIDGVEHPIFLNPDTATVVEGHVLEVSGAGSVLDNDVDPDSQGAMTVLSMSSTLQNTVGVLPDGSLATIAGQYGTLTFDCKGNYGYVPFPEYRYSRDRLTDVFQYSAINEVVDAGWGELTIEILPDPEIKFLIPMQTDVFFLDEGLAVIGGAAPVENGPYEKTILGSFSIESFSEGSPQIGIFYEGFSISSQENQSIFFDAVIWATFVTPFVELIEQTESADGVWTTRYVVGLNTQTSLTNFQSMSDGDEITLSYVITGTDQQPYIGTQAIQVLILGENDAPTLTADHDLVYVGHSAVGVSGSVSGLLFNDYDVDVNDSFRIGAIGFGETVVSFTSQNPSPFESLMLEGAYGWLTVYAAGDYTYTANKAAAQLIEPVSDTVDPTYEIFTYQVVDEAGASAEQQLIIQVLGPNDKPTAIDDAFTVYLDLVDMSEPVYKLFDNDLDVDPSRLRLTGTTNFPGNFLQINEQGHVYFQGSALDYLKSGEPLYLSFDYSVGNGVTGSDTGEVFIQIFGKNEPPHGHDDVYFYENDEGSVLDISVSDGLIFRVHVSNETADSDVDGDSLIITGISDTPLDSGAPVTWVMMDNGEASLTLSGGISLIVQSDGSFVMDAPDGYMGTVEFGYLLSDGLDLYGAKATVMVGGPGSLDGHLMINEISMQNGAVVRNVYTDNGDAPNRILVGAASIELLNTSDEAIGAAALATLTLEIVGPDGSLTTISLGELTGLTMDASGEALNQIAIPAGGILMLYEPGALGLGTWAVYGPNKSFVAGASGSYAGQAWPMGSTTEDALAVNLVQGGTSIDFFAANGADTEGLTGIIGLGDSAQGEQGMAGVPWAGDHLGLLSEEQYDGTLSGEADTVFGRTNFTDTDSELDWSHYVFLARTVGDTNTKLYRGAALFVANPEDPTENLNPNQDQSSSEGQDKQTGSGSLVGGSGHDVLMGQEEDDDLFGDELDDWLHGGAGNDSLEGGSGGDWLQGGAGTDQLSGGSGADVFVFAAVSDSPLGSGDMIEDFSLNEDRIDLSAVDADASLEGNQAFEWGSLVSGRSQAAAMTGKVVYWVENGMTVVQADVADDHLAPLELIISGVKALSAADFVM